MIDIEVDIFDVFDIIIIIFILITNIAIKILMSFG